MVIRANIKEALRSLITSKQRTILALIGIIIGIGSVIGMVSIGEAVKREVMKQFLEMGIDIIQVTKDEKKNGQKADLRFDDIVQIKQHIPSIAEVSPFIQSSTAFKISEKSPLHISAFGVTESFFDINKLKVKEGRMIRNLDSNRSYCVIGNKTAKALSLSFKGNIIGSYIAFENRVFTVIGVLEEVSPGGSIRPSNLNESIITHITTGARAFDNANISQFLARIKAGHNPSDTEEPLKAYFSKRTSGRLHVRVHTAEEMIDQMAKQMRLLTLLLGAIGSISLAVGGVGVMNVMLVSVSERRREIGIRRAIGAQRNDIQSQFIIESVILCLAGGVLGISIGVLFSYFFSRFSHWDFAVSITAIILGVGVSTVVGLFFGYYPARSASRLNPIDALRM